MSTELKSIKVKIEVPNIEKREVEYKSTKLNLTRFFGGKERGTSLQMGFFNERGEYQFVQLDEKSVKKLKKILKTEF